MGAGCNYTNRETETKAFWIDLGFEWDENLNEVTNQIRYNDIWEDTNLDLIYVFKDIGYDQNSKGNFCNGLGKIELESTHDGNGVVIRLEPLSTEIWHHEDIKKYNLFMANHYIMYERIKKKLLDSGYSLRIATSGYTSTEIKKVS